MPYLQLVDAKEKKIETLELNKKVLPDSNTYHTSDMEIAVLKATE